MSLVKKNDLTHLAYVWMALKRKMIASGILYVGPIHYSWDLEVQKNTTFKLKLGLIVLFTQLKIILL